MPLGRGCQRLQFAGAENPIALLLGQFAGPELPQQARARWEAHTVSCALPI